MSTTPQLYQHLYLHQLTTDEALKAFEYLSKAHVGDYFVENRDNSETSTKFGVSLNGNKASNYFFQPYRLRAHHKEKGSYEGYFERHGIERVQELALKYSKKEKLDDLKPHDYQSVLSLRVASINQFKPRVAACLYDQFKPKCVLDFSAGWGDRCVAAMAKGINYIGIDSNTELERPYNDMIKFFKEYANVSSSVQMHFMPSETFDFSQYDQQYDMMFTSPPYYDIEIYENMPTYTSYEDWESKFLQTVVRKSWEYLKEGGWMCLNIPSNKYDARRKKTFDCFESVKKVLGQPTKKIQMLLQNRSKQGESNYEYIYCWNKGGENVDLESEDESEESVDEVTTRMSSTSLNTRKEDTELVRELRQKIKKLEDENKALRDCLRVYL